MTADESENLWGYAKRLHFIRDTIRLSFKEKRAAEVHILDVGCGNGSQLAIPLARDGFQLTGVDPHTASITRARALAKDISCARFICGNVEDLPVDQVFDMVILSEVLEHLEDPERLFKASLTHLKQNGVMIVTVPNGYGEFEIDWWLFRALRLPKLLHAFGSRSGEQIGSTDNIESGHVQFFTLRRLKRIFKECNLVITREGTGSLLGGPFVAYSLARSTRFLNWNARITERLPASLASSWYFALRRRTDVTDTSCASL
jgi:SAM-dependent methyltransferase